MTMTYRWEAEHTLIVSRETRAFRLGIKSKSPAWWGPSRWPSMQGENATPADAMRQLVEFGAGGQRYRMVRSDGEVILTVEPGWRVA